MWAARVAAVHPLPREGYAGRAFSMDVDALADLPFPVLILRGSESPGWLRSAAEAAHEAIGESRLIELEDQGHMAMDIAPERFANAVLEFSRISRAAAAR